MFVFELRGRFDTLHPYKGAPVKLVIPTLDWAKQCPRPSGMVNNIGRSIDVLEIPIIHFITQITYLFLLRSCPGNETASFI